jgi:glycosyltransferase involved in cell wall biosynthesis
VTAYLKAIDTQYYLESEGGLPRWLVPQVMGETHGGKEAYFCTPVVHDEYHLAHGARTYPLIRYPSTSVREKNMLREPPDAGQKLGAKQQLVTTKPNMILSVGRFIPRNGYRLLTKACASLTDDTAVCHLGGDPPNGYRQLFSDLGPSSVHSAEFRQGKELSVNHTTADEPARGLVRRSGV